MPHILPMGGRRGSGDRCTRGSFSPWLEAGSETAYLILENGIPNPPLGLLADSKRASGDHTFSDKWVL